MPPQLPNLQILPTPSLLLHEDHDKQRTLPLVDKLRAQGVLRNPPIVMPLEDGTERYMVLDGANRVTSLQEMEFPHIVAQVVAPDDPHVRLETWGHVVWGMSVRDLIAGVREVAGLKLMPIERGSKKREELDCMPVEIQLEDGRAYLSCTTRDGIQLAAYLNGVVDAYKDKSFLDRTMETDVEKFRDIHADLTALIIYPKFEIKTVLELTGKGFLLPTGITRFTVSPRALHLNYPLHELSSAKPVEYKQKYLNRWVQDRIKHKNVRYYAEATFLFDE
jgi:L-serine kinase (ATP) / ParB family transcriptional regulator, heme-responsive regulator